MEEKNAELNANRRFLLAVFEREDEILAATRAVRAKGLRIADVYAPYAVHGLDEAMGLKASWLPWVSFALGMTGAGLKVWFEYWTSGTDWPLNVGGKPWNSLPAFIPVTFEVMVLFAGVGTVLAFFAGRRLFPGRRARLAYPGVTDDRFALVVEETDAAFDAGQVTRWLQEHHAIHVEERLEQELPK